MKHCLDTASFILSACSCFFFFLPFSLRIDLRAGTAVYQDSCPTCAAGEHGRALSGSPYRLVTSPGRFARWQAPSRDKTAVRTPVHRPGHGRMQPILARITETVSRCSNRLGCSPKVPQCRRRCRKRRGLRCNSTAERVSIADPYGPPAFEFTWSPNREQTAKVPPRVCWPLCATARK